MTIQEFRSLSIEALTVDDCEIMHNKYGADILCEDGRAVSMTINCTGPGGE